MSRSLLFFLCVAFALLGGCGYDESPAAPGGDGTPVAPKETLAFIPTTPLQLDPGATAVLAVQVSPPRATKVLFGIVGDPKNQAFLSAESSDTDAEGKAYVSLTGALSPGSFRVRAGLANGPSAERAVSISGKGFGSLLVTANYSGTRELKEWVASAWPDLQCSSLVPEYPTGPSVARGASPLSLGPLAVGPSFAVIVRSGNVAAGCLDVAGLAPDTVRPVTVDLSDLPVVPASSFLAEMRLSELDAALLELLREAVEARLDDAKKPSTEVEWMMDALIDSLPPGEQGAFDTAGDSYDLEQIVADFLGSEGKLKAVFRSQLVRATASLAGAPPLRASFDPRSTRPEFVVIDAAGIPADEAGFESEEPWSLTTDTDDSFVLGGKFGFYPVRWLAAIARRNAIDEQVTFAESLGHDFSCDEFGIQLVPQNQPLYAGCETGCLVALCADALELLFHSWIETDETMLSMNIAASGVVQSDPSGALLVMDGRYIGSIEGHRGTVLAGTFVANPE